MKLKVLVCCLTLLLPLSLFAKAPADKGPTGDMAAAIDTDSWIDINKLLMFFSNTGHFAHQSANTLGKSDGLYFPYTSVDDIESGAQDNTVIFAAGPWIGCMERVTRDTLTVISEFSDEYFPGPMVGGTFIDGADTDPNYRVFRLYKDSLADNPGGDYDDYMQYAIAQGAPTWAEDTYRYDTTFDELGAVESVDTVLLGLQGEPRILGDMFVWSVFNDANPEYKTNDASGTDPIGLEIQASCFGFDREDALGNIYFLRYRIYNKGALDLDSMFISLWADPDLGGASDDLVGCDTLLDLGYCYNATNTDNDYGSSPPAVGFDFFQGPLVFTGDDADTAIMWDFQRHPGYVNMGMTSFNKYINGTDPQNYVWTYQYMNGLDASQGGTPLPNGTKYFGPGDPVTATGDLDAAPDDRRWMQTTGPITMDAGDSTEILAAVVVGQGSDRLTSISAMKFFDRFAQSAYDLDFNLPSPPAPPEVTVHQLPGQISLEWTRISETSPGDFDFEGYTVFQGPSAAGPWKRIANYDLNNGVGIIFDDEFDLDDGVVVNVPVKFGSDNGVARYFGTNLDFVDGGTLSNVTDYYYKVEAYSYDPAATPKTLTSATVVRATPQGELAGTDYSAEFGTVIEVTHTGPSDGVVTPFVIDPGALTGHQYRVIFEDDGAGGFIWSLIDLTANTVVLEEQINQAGDEDYEIVHGMLVRVEGPPSPGVKDWDIPQGTRRFTWAGANFGWEAFSGAIGWGSPHWVWGGGDPVPPAELVNVVLRLATVTVDGTFDAGDENVSYAYRYGRGFSAPPAQPEFAPFIINTAGLGYDFQDYERSCPLSAWNIDVDPPQRLAVGYLENNAEYGAVDGKYWPRESDFFGQEPMASLGIDNIAGDGPREWLFIFNAPYTDDTPEAAYSIDVIGEPVPVMYWLTVNRRGSDVPFSPDASGQDEFLIIPAKINSAADTFTFVAEAPVVVTSGEQNMDEIRAVPNPYYLASSFDNSVFERRMRFTNLPADATIKIFNLSGDLIATVPRSQPTESWEAWTVETASGIPVASGIYIYVVESPAFGTKIGKMAIFIEEEQLGTF
ncbi:MAG: hypothetical protein JSW34_11970 [Candidatus Zixiibacteriota bacterium]|nr:MAG: hypothetical protein JSW34_11970 [candidate division Zixibacteria bacterium]